MPLDGGSVAFAQVNTGSPTSGLFTHAIRLEPNTAYVLSAYLWNFGNAANRVTTAIDFSNAKMREPQMTSSYTDASADQGYFVYRSFNTTETGTNITLRVFYDGLTGAGAAPASAPAGRNGTTWLSPSPLIFSRLKPAARRPTSGRWSPSPARGMAKACSSKPFLPFFPITTMASDLDGTIAKVEFFADATKLGEITNSPYTCFGQTSPQAGTN